jgi:VWFA-related protein
MKFLAGVLTTLSCLTLSASRLPGPQTPVFVSKVDTVRVDVMVTDRGQPVPGLQPKDFTVTDAGVRQAVDIVAFEDAPLNVVLALDVSGSVQGERLTQLREAAETLLDRLKAGDTVGLMTFGSAVVVQAAPTNDISRVRAALIAPGGGDDETALVDASYSAMALSRSDDGRALVIVLTDGTDTASFLRPSDVLDSAKRADAVVYGVSSTQRDEPAFLHDLCEFTGGRIVREASVRTLGQTFVRILEEFRHRYVLSYTPRGVPKRGWHPIKVGIVGRRLTVTARPGYLLSQ